MDVTQLNELRSLFSADRFKTDPESLATFGTDWTRFYEVKPSAVVFPVSSSEVIALVHWARRTKTALVPSGGRTGLSGGAVASRGEVVVNFSRMNRILEYSPFDQTVKVEPGVVTEQLIEFADKQNAFYPVDFAARGSSQIAGNIATNAGGVKVLRYGSTRDWVMGLKAVTGAGDLLELNRGLVKNATGYDLRHLFIGSEGTLGFIVEADMKLAPRPKGLKVMILAVPTLDGVMEIFRLFRSRLTLTAFEFFSEKALSLVTHHSKLQRPLQSTADQYILIELEANSEQGGPSADDALASNGTDEAILDCFEKALEMGWASDGAIAETSEQSRQFWRLREDISEACAPHTPYKNDVSVQISKVPEFLTRTDAALKAGYPDFDVIWFGHIGDGNMHINILKPGQMAKEQFINQCKKVNEIVFSIISDLGGSVSAEHGVGLLKKADLHHSRSQTEIKLMKALKAVFDPDGILNPGKIFD